MPALSVARHAVIWLVETLTRQRGSWRHAKHLLTWVVLMLAAVPLSDELKQADWWLLAALQPAPPQWPGAVALVDLGWDLDPAGTTAYRRHVAGTLQALAGLKPPPSIVVMDTSLSTLPIELDALRAAFARLREQHVHIIQVADLSGFATGLNRSDVLGYQGQQALHDFAGARYGHAAFEFSDAGTAWYVPCVAPPTLGPEECLEAVPRLVAQRVMRRPPEATPRADLLPTVLVPGNTAQALAHAWRWQADAGWQPLQPASGGTPDETLGGRIVVVGNLEHDQLGPWPGAALVGWAIGDAIATPDTPRTVLLRRPLWTLAAALVFSGVTLALLALLRRWDPRARHLGPTALGAALGAAVLLALCVLGLRTGLQVAYYQIGYVLLAIAATTAVAWHAASSAMRERALYTVISDEEDTASPTYDVFISYSHSPLSNIERVQREVVEPLQRLQTPAGPLRVFFDTKSIRVGTSWYLELAEGIERSRCFVALYTSDYFHKSFCRFEMRKAVVRDIAANRHGFRVLPFKLDPDTEPPPEFSHLQYQEPKTAFELVETVRAALAELGVACG